MRGKRRPALQPEDTIIARFQPLAVYNAEVARGIVHTREWDAKMAELQREFDEHAAEVQRTLDAK